MSRRAESPEGSKMRQEATMPKKVDVDEITDALERIEQRAAMLALFFGLLDNQAGQGDAETMNALLADHDTAWAGLEQAMEALRDDASVIADGVRQLAKDA